MSFLQQWYWLWKAVYFKSPVRDPVDYGELACPFGRLRASSERPVVSKVEGPKPPVSAKAPAVAGSVKIYLIRIRENPCAARLGHPEPAAKDLAREGESSSLRSPDPSLRCAAFRMTHRARIDHNPYDWSGRPSRPGLAETDGPCRSPEWCLIRKLYSQWWFGHEDRRTDLKGTAYECFTRRLDSSTVLQLGHRGVDHRCYHLPSKIGVDDSRCICWVYYRTFSGSPLFWSTRNIHRSHRIVDSGTTHGALVFRQNPCLARHCRALRDRLCQLLSALQDALYAVVPIGDCGRHSTVVRALFTSRCDSGSPLFTAERRDRRGED